MLCLTPLARRQRARLALPCSMCAGLRHTEWPSPHERGPSSARLGTTPERGNKNAEPARARVRHTTAMAPAVAMAQRPQRQKTRRGEARRAHGGTRTPKRGHLVPARALKRVRTRFAHLPESDRPVCVVKPDWGCHRIARTTTPSRSSSSIHLLSSPTPHYPRTTITTTPMDAQELRQLSRTEIQKLAKVRVRPSCSCSCSFFVSVFVIRARPFVARGPTHPHARLRSPARRNRQVHGLKANLKTASIIAQLVALLPTGVPRYVPTHPRPTTLRATAPNPPPHSRSHSRSQAHAHAHTCTCRLPRAPSPTASETGQKPAEQKHKQKQSRAGRTPGVATRRSARLRPRPPVDEEPSPAETRPNARRKTPRAKPAPRTENPQATIKQESRSDTAAEPAARRGTSSPAPAPARGVRWAPTPGTRVAEWRERLYAGGGPAPSPEPIPDPDAAPLDPTTETRITRAQAEFVADELGEMRAAGAVARRVREVRGVVAGIAAAVGEVGAEGGAGARMRMGMRGVLEAALAAQARERREGLRGARGDAQGGSRGQARMQQETQARARGEGSKRKRSIEEDEDEDEAAYRASRSRSHAGELWASSPSGSVEV